LGLREEKKQEQRTAILATTLELFRSQGFEATRVQEVTERLRISEGTFFNYFPSKAAVLDAAAVDLLDRATALLHRDVADHDRPVLARL
jgi:AcrR family transcriptional regulator